MCFSCTASLRPSLRDYFPLILPYYLQHHKLWDEEWTCTNLRLLCWLTVMCQIVPWSASARIPFRDLSLSLEKYDRWDGRRWRDGCCACLSLCFSRMKHGCMEGEVRRGLRGSEPWAQNEIFTYLQYIFSWPPSSRLSACFLFCMFSGLTGPLSPPPPSPCVSIRVCVCARGNVCTGSSTLSPTATCDS